MAKIEDRAERLRVEREVQRESSELKRQAKAAAHATSVSSNARRATPGTSSGGVRIVRDGKLLEKPTEVEEAAEPSQDVPSRPIQKGDKLTFKSFRPISTVTPN